MKTKKILKPFSIEAWKNGAKVETRDGHSVRILCTDLKSVYPIIAAVMCKDGEECTIGCTNNGSYCEDGVEDDFDLVIVEEVEEPKRWADDKEARGYGWHLFSDSQIFPCEARLNIEANYCVFATEKQAKSALAMARISQLMAHDERYGGVVTDEEWRNCTIPKCVMLTEYGEIYRRRAWVECCFLAFHTENQCDLFLSENEQLVKDYLMVD